MGTGLQSPPFLTGLFSLLLLHFSSYVMGYFLIRLSGFSTRLVIYREFTRLIVGFLSLLLVFAAVISGGLTILLGLLIPIFFLVRQMPFSKGTSDPFLPPWNLVLIHFVFLFIFFGAGFLSIFNPVSGNLLDPGVDCYVFARYCEHMLLTGEENIFLDWYLPIDQGNSFYHYSDLWAANLVTWFSGLKPIHALYLVSTPFTILVACWAALSFLEAAGFKASLVNVILCVALYVFSPVREFLEPVFHALINPSLISTYSLFVYPKLAIVAVFLIWGLRQFLLEDYRGGFLALVPITFLHSSIIPPFYLSMFFFGLFLLVTRKLYVKELISCVLPAVAALIFVFTLYWASGGTSYDNRLSGMSNFSWLFDGMNGLLSVSKLSIVLGLTAFFGWIPFYPLLAVLKFRSFTSFRTFLFRPIPVFLFLFIISGALSFSFFHTISDSAQFWSIPVSIATSAGLVWLFAKVFNAQGFMILKILSVSIIVLLCWQNYPFPKEVKDQEKAFLENILNETDNDSLKYAFLWVRQNGGISMKDHNVYDPLLILTSQVSHFRPVSITMRETVRDSSAYFDLPLKRMIEISEINRYVEGQISLGTYISESESKLSFMREFEIPFAMIAPDYPLDSVLTPHFIRLFSSPSGWDFCRFTDEPRNRILGL